MLYNNSSKTKASQLAIALFGRYHNAVDGKNRREKAMSTIKDNDQQTCENYTEPLQQFNHEPESGEIANTTTVSNRTEIVAIATGGYHTVGLKSDGTAVAVGRNRYGQCNVSGWTDLVAIAAGYKHTVGLKSDGTAVAVGRNDFCQCNVFGWTDLVAIAVGDDYTVGLKSDGTVVAVGNNHCGQ
jgi:alpha-tubulin suppressor-like RCC1 family protein